MKKYLLGLLFFSGIALAAAGDRFISNPTQDKNIVFQVNKGGTVTDALTIYGASGVAASTVATNIRASEGAGTTTLTVADSPNQVFNLSGARTLVLATTGVKAGYKYVIENRATFLLTIQSSNLTTMTMANVAVGSVGHPSITRGHVTLVAIQDAPTTPAHWMVSDVYEYIDNTAVFASESGSEDIFFYGVRQNLMVAAIFRTDSLITLATTGLSFTALVPDRFRPTTRTAFQTLASGSIGVVGVSFYVNENGSGEIYKTNGSGAFTIGDTFRIDGVAGNGDAAASWMIRQ